MTETVEIPPRSGTAFLLPAGATLTVIDPCGEQVSDLVAFAQADVREVISNGRTFDYEESMVLTTGNRLWSNRSRPMLEIVHDMVGRHDFLLTPCSEATFRHFYPGKPLHRGCLGNLAEALAPYGIAGDSIPTAFNIFMNVSVDGESGRLRVLPPLSKVNDSIRFRALMDLVIGMTACSAYDSNAGSFKPIQYAVTRD
ncbi:DUF1989 domain-containing protein [Novosphingobium sp. CCH12-A3]|uniref:DUF1989 domain-containing protein n=1 Tax=Novosphingobium sp. CCH12-A3 TaxID=1768752 RepID=UPI000781D8B1|nr:urea carboxylase-associated family protein [Novosphingobium sp. CCH12-A3]